MKRHLIAALLLLSLLPVAALGWAGNVTRGEFVMLLWTVSGAVPFDKTAHPFTDLAGREELEQAAAWAYDLGLVKGVGEDRFAPDRLLTREECATLLRRNDTRLGREVFLPDGAAECNDGLDISPWADDSLYWACITGRMDWWRSRLCPTGPVTVQELTRYFAPELELYPDAMEEVFLQNLDP